MPKANNGFQVVSLRPLTGMLDVRSRPADIPLGAFRYKGWFEVTSEGKLLRRSGYQRFFSDRLYDAAGVPLSDPSAGAGGPIIHNHDLHHQGAAREPIIRLFESTASDGFRRLFAGTKTRYYVLDDTTGYWTLLFTGGGPNARWHQDELKDTLVATNNVDPVQYHVLGSTTMQVIPTLYSNVGVTSAKIAIQFYGCMFVMNVVQGGTNQPTRIRWSDLNLPLMWEPLVPANSLAGFQDLDYGDDILAAAKMLGSLYILTRRSIWKVDVTQGSTGTTPFTFQKVYTETKNSTGCIAFPESLISTGTELWYMSRDGIYNYTPYLPMPERQDWLHRADGAIYVMPTSLLDSTTCDAPVGEFVPAKKEIWFSWPSTGHAPINNFTLVAHIEQKTADILDDGFTALVNYRRNPLGLQCNEFQDFIGASGRDYAIKSIGGDAFYRELLVMPDDNPATDLPLDLVPDDYERLGYNSILRGFVPLGLMDREKILRNIVLDDDTREQDVPCAVKCRIGNHVNLVDPNSTAAYCSPLWRFTQIQRLACPDVETIAQMTANNLRPSVLKNFDCYEQGRFLYFEFTIQNADGTPAIGGNSAWSRLDFDVLALPKS